ncbi:unnamed protein product [Clavelina lepadiformis]|uniref:Uncharacterized protein n=1 Tax=Clavelina lepadiformis TaxID=159417 RepID=A0ABP0GYM2_CLALP
MVQKSLEEKVKLLTKVNEEKNDDASLTVRQLVALVGISKRTLQDWQKNDANLREQREETMLRGRGLKTERKRLRMLTIRPVLAGTVPLFNVLSRRPDRSAKRPGLAFSQPA